MSQVLRTAISIQDSYISSSEDAKGFPSCKLSPRNYLNREEIEELFPQGFITHNRFYHLGAYYRLVHRFVPLSETLMYAAVLEEDMVPGARSEPTSWPTTRLMDRVANPGLQVVPFNNPSSSMPLERSISSPRGTSLMQSATHNMQELMRSYSAQTRYFQLASSSIPGSDSLAEKNKFIEDLLSANESPVPLDRYKALVRLMSYLKRQLAAAQILNADHPRSWDDPHHLDLLKRIVLVGECLARFGTADFLQNSNSSRAITAKDYTTLLTQYLDNHGAVFTTPFIGGLDQAMQDDVLTVRSLLETRCEANSLIFTQLIKHVGLEGKGAGASTTMVYNASVVNANPTNTVTASPTTNTTTNTVTNTAAQALAKLKTMQGNWPMLLAGAAGLLVLWKGGRSLFGGGRGKKQDSRSRRWPELSDTEEDVSRRRRNGTVRDAHTERVAAQMLVACQGELNKLMHNQELLENDWRLGKLRLTSPGNPYPPGYSHPNPMACNLHDFYRALSSDTSMYFPPTQMFMPSYPPSPIMLPPPSSSGPITDPRRLLPAPRESNTSSGSASTGGAPSILEVLAMGASQASAASSGGKTSPVVVATVLDGDVK